MTTGTSALSLTINEPMTLDTTRFGLVTIPPERLLAMISPILGFEAHTGFALLDHEEDSPFQWLQSLVDPSLAFVVTSPALFGLDYEFTLPEAAAELLAVKSTEDILVLTLVTVPEENPAHMTTNLLGPIVVNLPQRKAMQVILADNQLYGTRVRLISDETLQAESE